MYQALYRKWRSKTFSEVVGQEHVTETLRRQVATGRVSHAYLFTGTRGCGKTSCARILARAVNCLSPRDGEPCNECAVCRGILDGSILDVTELDAASNNGVGDIRDLREELVYAPATTRRRVYIIDEVHMLSGPAFNALLKTLEEPPAHVLFILATTEVQKVPATILSRCQRFSFKRISTQDIAQHLLRMSEQEPFTLTEDAAYLIAHMADGAMRDAQSILEQCASAGTVDRELVMNLLGLMGEQRTTELFESIADQQSSRALELLNQLYTEGKAIPALLEELTRLYRDVLVFRTTGNAALTGGDPETLRRLSIKMEPEQLLYGITLLQEALAGLGRSASPRIEAETTLLRLCDPTLCDLPAALSVRVARLERQGVAQPKVQKRPATDSATRSETREPSVPAIKKETGEKKESVEKQEEDRTDTSFWPEVLQRLHGVVSPMLYTHLSLLEPVLSGDTLTLTAQEDLTLSLLKGRVEQSVADAMQAVSGKTVTVRLGKKREPVSPTQDKLDDLIAAAGDLIHFTD